jgi:general secretion pathway protein D
MSTPKQNLSYLLAMSLTMVGCEALGPKPHEKMPIYPVSQMTDLEQEPEVVFEELSNEATAQQQNIKSEIELYPGTGHFADTTRGSKKPPVGGKGEYSLNFDDADLGEVSKVILSDILGQNYVLSPKVAGKVTLQTTQPLSRQELLPTLEMLLELNGAALSYQNGVYRIEPATDIIGSSVFVGLKHSKLPPGYQVRVVPVRYVAVDQLAEVIKPLLEEKTILHSDSNRNMMLVAGTAAELERVMDMVNTFDIDVMKGRSFGLFPLQQVEAGKIIEELEQVFAGASGQAESGFFQFMEIERLNAVLAITHQAKYLRDIERWIIRLDRANTAAGGGVMVYRAQHVDAVVMAETLNNIFGGKSGKAASVAAGRKTVEVTNKNKTEEKAPQPTSGKTNTSISDIGDVNIIADEVNNALIIVATAQDYAVVERVIKQLDVMPLQVLIDATIVDVSLTDNLKYGIKWFLSHNNGKNAGSTGDNFATEQDRIGLSDFGSFKDTAANLAIGAATGGFGYAFISNSGDVKAVLNAESAKGNVNIISSPSLMVLNNQEANIQVGNEVSLRTSESTNTNAGADNAFVTNTIQQRKTGVTVNVKPRVNANGLVIMEIEQKIEDFAGGSTNGNPDILSREIKSSVAVQSGETIVLGGLISQKKTNEKDGIPFLHELPLIGPLFGSTSKGNEKAELVVLITPRVVRSRQDARIVTNEFKRKLTGIYEEPVVVDVEQEGI